MNQKLWAVELDIEWLQLIKEAKNLGLNIEEIRKFICNNQNEFPILKNG